MKGVGEAAEILRRISTLARDFVELDKQAQIEGVSKRDYDNARAELEEEITYAKMWLAFGQSGEIRITKTRKK